MMYVSTRNPPTTSAARGTKTSERVFRMVRKIVTENRMTLDNRTVCALLSCKINHSGPAHKYIPSKTVLNNAKSAINLYNNSLKE